MTSTHTLKRKLIQCVTRKQRKRTEKKERKKSSMNMRLDASRTEKGKQKKDI